MSGRLLRSPIFVDINLRNQPRDKCFRRPNCSTLECFISGFSRGQFAFTYITRTTTSRTTNTSSVNVIFDFSIDRLLSPYSSYFLSRRSSPAPGDKAIVIDFAKESFVTPAKCEQDRREGRNDVLLFAHEFLARVTRLHCVHVSHRFNFLL